MSHNDSTPHGAGTDGGGAVDLSDRSLTTEQILK